MRSQILFVSVLTAGATVIFALGALTAVLLGGVSERNGSRPVASIALNLPAQANGSGEDEPGSNMARADDAQRIAALKHELTESRRQALAAKAEARSASEKLTAELQAAQQKNAALSAALESAKHERDEARAIAAASSDTVNVLRRELAGTSGGAGSLHASFPTNITALREALARKDREIAALRKAAGEIESSVAPAAGGAAQSPSAAPPTAVPSGSDSADAPATGGSVEDGVAAYQAGAYHDAYRIWQSLAAQGDARAQFHLGALYYEGRGVERDLATARQWLSRASENGSSLARALLARLDEDQHAQGSTGSMKPATDH